MRNIIGFVKKIFRKQKNGSKCWVNVGEIKVNPEWRKTRIGKAKFRRKLDYWYLTGEFQSDIILDKDFNLLDGYSSVRIAETRGVSKVPVYFAD